MPLPLRATGHRPALEHEPVGRLRAAGAAQSSGHAPHDRTEAVLICSHRAGAPSALPRGPILFSVRLGEHTRQGSVCPTTVQFSQARVASPGAAAPPLGCSHVA